MQLQSKEEFKTTVLHFEDENDEYIVTYSDSTFGIWVWEQEWDVRTIDNDEVEGELRDQLIELSKTYL
jgi:hypothetical protein